MTGKWQADFHILIKFQIDICIFYMFKIMG
jgi:hypothetical protein